MKLLWKVQIVPQVVFMSPTGSVRSRYDRLVASGSVEKDPAQLNLALRMDKLLAELSEYRLARKSSALGWLFSRKGKPEAPQGLYLWGGVGRGKSMMMDLFFEAADVKRKKRVHFHAFMADIHARIHEWREAARKGHVKGDDPIASLAAIITEEAWLLCFDEFAVTDITDAMILSRLFTALFAQGVVVVATSNVVPDKLYEGGLNRALFVPFIELLKQKTHIVELKSRTDFRLEKLSSDPVYYHPLSEQIRARMDAMFLKLSGHKNGEKTVLVIHGHELVIPEAASGIARISFNELCGRAYGANDYLHLARQFHTLLLDDIPVMDEARRNEARRFIWLIDALYEQGVKLIASAQDEAQKLYQAGTGYEAFAFDRTISRLIEMRSDDYLKKPHAGGDSKGSGRTTGLVET